MASAIASTSFYIFPTSQTNPTSPRFPSSRRSTRKTSSPVYFEQDDYQPNSDSSGDDEDEYVEELLRVKDEPKSDSEDFPFDEEEEEGEAEFEEKKPRIKGESFECSYDGCTKTYGRRSRLEEHERSHTGERPFVCSECSSSFTRDSHLKAHLRTHASESDKSLSCPEPGCDKMFWTNQHLKKHIEVVHRGKTYDCSQCDEKFRKHHQLRAHFAEVHCTPGTKPFLCDHEGCDRSFSQKVHLKAHQKTHDPSRYICLHPDCSSLPLSQRQFSVWSHLQKHQKTVHPPTCPHAVCRGKTFTTQRGLRNHLLIHEREEAKGEEGKDFGDPKMRSNVKRKRSERRNKKRERRGGEGDGKVQVKVEETSVATTTTVEGEMEAEDGSDWEDRQESERDERMREDFRIGGKKKRRIYDESHGLTVTAHPTPALRPALSLPSPFNDPPPPHSHHEPSAPSSQYLDMLTGTNYSSTSQNAPTSSSSNGNGGKGPLRLIRRFPCPFPAILGLPFHDVKPSSRNRPSRPLSPTIFGEEEGDAAVAKARQEDVAELQDVDEREGEDDDDDGVGGEEGTCKYWYKRVYDVERHLRSQHGVAMDGGRKVLAMWYEKEKE